MIKGLKKALHKHRIQLGLKKRGVRTAPKQKAKRKVAKRRPAKRKVAKRKVAKRRPAKRKVAKRKVAKRRPAKRKVARKSTPKSRFVAKCKRSGCTQAQAEGLWQAQRARKQKAKKRPAKKKAKKKGSKRPGNFTWRGLSVKVWQIGATEHWQGNMVGTRGGTLPVRVPGQHATKKSAEAAARRWLNAQQRKGGPRRPKKD